jgi:hypothetical protein
MPMVQMMVKDFLSQKEMAAIGSVVAESANLERCLDGYIMKISRLNRAQYDVLVGGKMLGAKIAIFKDLGLLKIKSKKKQKGFSKTMDSLSLRNAERVVAIHGIWAPAGGITSELVEGMFSGKLKPNHLPPGVAIHRKGRGKWFKMEAKHLEDLAQEIVDGMGELTKFWDPKWYRETEKAIEEAAAIRKAKRAALQEQGTRDGNSSTE